MAVKDVGRGPTPNPRLEIAVHNIGARRVVIDQARVEVKRIYELKRCASQDDLPLSNSYGLTLPVNAQKGDVFDQPLHQQVGPDEADRFAIALSAGPLRDRPSSVFLFEIKVGLFSDGPRPMLSAGTAQVSLPKLPLIGEYFWGEGTRQILHGFVIEGGEIVKELRRFSMPCWRSNTDLLRDAFQSRAVRSTQMEEISRELVTPTLTALK